MKNPFHIFLIFSLFFLLNLPDRVVNRLRYFSVSWASPGFQLLAYRGAKSPITLEQKQELQKLKLENQMLKTQLEAVQEWLQFDQRIEELTFAYKSVEKDEDDFLLREFFQRRSEELNRLLKLHLQVIPARVIFRDPSFWSSSCWIGVGEKDNEKLERNIIAKNSPVVLGSSLVGIVEYVGMHQSRVRFITDSGLVPSVRAIRGRAQNHELYKSLNQFSHWIKTRKDLFPTKEEHILFFNTLQEIKNKITLTSKDSYLAKGQLMGSSAPLWRCCNQLKGIGFNYDYVDEEGPSRDLRTGDPLIGKIAAQEAILQEGDLLVTTGMDGVFPAGLNVAIVSSIDDLEDGGYAYSLKAEPTAGNLQELGTVFILPPISDYPEEFN